MPRGRQLIVLAFLALLAACGTGGWDGTGAGHSGALGRGGAADGAHGELSLRINEVMSAPVDDRSGEYVEVYNDSPWPVALAGLVIDDGDSSDRLVHLTGPETVGGFGYGLLVDPDFRRFADVPAGVPVYTSRDRALGNGLSGSDPIELRTADGLVLDRVGPAPSGRGQARERRAPSLADAPTSWRLVDGGSPGRRNRLAPSDRLRIRFTHPGDDAETVAALIDFIDATERTLDCAIYQMNHPVVMDALLRAHRRGVTVRIITDSTFYDREDYRIGYVPLEEAGIRVVADQRSSEQHNKFLVSDGEWVWLGSYNPTTNETADSAVELWHPPIAAELTAQVDEMDVRRFGVWREPTSVQDHDVDSIPVRLMASPKDGIEDAVAEAILSAEHSVHFLAFGLTLDSIGDALLDRHSAGVEVRGAIDWLHASRNGSEWYRLEASGADVRRSPHAMLMHHKLVVIDAGTPNALVITGSYNFTGRAETRNDETMLFIRDARIAAASEGAIAAVLAESVPPEGIEPVQLSLTEVAQGAQSWVEIANDGDAPVSLEGMALSNLEETSHLPRATLDPGARQVVPFEGTLGGLDALLLLDAEGHALDGVAPRRLTAGSGETLQRIGPVTWTPSAATPGS